MAGADVARQTREQVQAAALAPTSGQPTVIDLIRKQEPAIAKALPAHIDGERFARIALTLVRSTPKLLECEPMSFIGSLMVAAQLGLEPGPPLGLSWIIPRKNGKTGKQEANFQMGYKGVLKLFQQSGQFRSIAAREVREGDQFDYEYGLDDQLHHKPALTGRGTSYAWYAVAQFRDGGHAFIVLSREEVEARRGRGQDGPAWRTDYDSMAKKSAVLALAPWLPLSPELEKALAADNRSFTKVEANLVDTPAEEPFGELEAAAPTDDEPAYAPGEEPFDS